MLAAADVAEVTNELATDSALLTMLLSREVALDRILLTLLSTLL